MFDPTIYGLEPLSCQNSQKFQQQQQQQQQDKFEITTSSRSRRKSANDEKFSDANNAGTNDSVADSMGTADSTSSTPPLTLMETGSTEGCTGSGSVSRKTSTASEYTSLSSDYTPDNTITSSSSPSTVEQVQNKISVTSIDLDANPSSVVMTPTTSTVTVTENSNVPMSSQIDLTTSTVTDNTASMGNTDDIATDLSGGVGKTPVAAGGVSEVKSKAVRKISRFLVSPVVAVDREGNTRVEPGQTSSAVTSPDTEMPLVSNLLSTNSKLPFQSKLSSDICDASVLGGNQMTIQQQTQVSQQIPPQQMPQQQSIQQIPIVAQQQTTLQQQQPIPQQQQSVSQQQILHSQSQQISQQNYRPPVQLQSQTQPIQRQQVSIQQNVQPVSATPSIGQPSQQIKTETGNVPKQVGPEHINTLEQLKIGLENITHAHVPTTIKASGSGSGSISSSVSGTTGSIQSTALSAQHTTVLQTGLVAASQLSTLHSAGDSNINVMTEELSTAMTGTQYVDSSMTYSKVLQQSFPTSTPHSAGPGILQVLSGTIVDQNIGVQQEQSLQQFQQQQQNVPSSATGTVQHPIGGSSVYNSRRTSIDNSGGTVTATDIANIPTNVIEGVEGTFTPPTLSSLNSIQSIGTSNAGTANGTAAGTAVQTPSDSGDPLKKLLQQQNSLEKSEG